MLDLDINFLSKNPWKSTVNACLSGDEQFVSFGIVLLEFSFWTYWCRAVQFNLGWETPKKLADALDSCIFVLPLPVRGYIIECWPIQTSTIASSLLEILHDDAAHYCMCEMYLQSFLWKYIGIRQGFPKNIQRIRYRQIDTYLLYVYIVQKHK